MEKTKKNKRPKLKSTHTGNKKFSPSWLIITVALTFCLSAAISFLTASRLQDVTLTVAFILLFVIIFIGIIFDIIGTAVTAASDAPLHAMASNRVRGARYAVKLIKHSEKTANVCNDVIGDICGVISGSIGTLIVGDLAISHSFNLALTSVLAAALISALTVGGKAVGKTFAITNCNAIVFFVGRFLYLFGRKR